jgi:hypothetical protein
VTPDKLGESQTESGQQRAVFAWAALNRSKWPELRWLHHIPNGGGRGESEQTAKIRGGNLKAEGVRPGVFDICLPTARGGYFGLYIEMKRPGKIKDTSDEQDEFGEHLSANGYAWRVCDTWKMAVETITEYLGWIPTQRGYVISQLERDRNAEI